MVGSRRVAVALVLAMAATTVLPACGLIFGSAEEAAKAKVELAPQPEIPDVANALEGDGSQRGEKRSKRATTTTTTKATTTTTTTTIVSSEEPRTRGSSGTPRRPAPTTPGTTPPPAGSPGPPIWFSPPDGVLAPLPPDWSPGPGCAAGVRLYAAGNAFWSQGPTSDEATRQKLVIAMWAAWHDFAPYAPPDLAETAALLEARSADLVSVMGGAEPPTFDEVSSMMSRLMQLGIPMIRRINYECTPPSLPRMVGGPANPPATGLFQRLIVEAVLGAGG